jgi:hypothetical protein
MNIYGQQWEDSLKGLSYPFQASEPPESEGNRIPVDFILDAALFMRSSTSRAVLSEIVVTPARGITMGFSDSAGDPVGTAVFPATGGGRVNVSFQGISVGFIVVDPDTTEIVRSWFPRTYVFSAPLIPHVVVVSDPAWRRGVTLPDGTTLTGDVYLVGANGIHLERTTTGFKVSGVGDPYAGRVEARRALKTINNVLPDIAGNISFVAMSPHDGPQRVSVSPLGSGRVRVELQGAT